MQTRSKTESTAVRPVSTRDLLPSERAFVAAMQQLGFGRFEFLRIERGELVLAPWPDCVRDVKFCASSTREHLPGGEFLLKPQVAELFEYTRDVDAGEIRTLEVKNGLPFSMEIQMAGGRRNA